MRKPEVCDCIYGPHPVLIDGNRYGHCEDCERPAVDFFPEGASYEYPDGAFLCAECGTIARSALARGSK